MLITRETDYALRILRALEDGKQRSIQEICDLEATPKQFAYRIIKKLERMGWIAIFRGVDGGCRLTADLASVNLFELMEGMGTDKSVSECLEPGYRCTRRDVCDDVCRMRAGLAQVQKALDEELKSHSILELLSGGEA